MPAPRLLDKKAANTAAATERKQQIDLGTALAKKVDAVRTTLNEEEARLDKYRRETIAKVQEEIDAKITERDSLEIENRKLREERLLAQAPIDLKEEWSLVREDKAANVLWTERLGQQSIELLAREEDNRFLSGELAQERLDIRREHELSQTNLREAEAEKTQADEALQRAEREAQRILETAEQRDNHLKVREQDATDREINLSRREEAVQTHEIDLSNREKKLKSRQEVFLKAQNYLKNKH